MSEMTEASIVRARLVPPHRRVRVVTAILVFLIGLASVSWVGSVSENEQLIQTHGE